MPFQLSLIDLVHHTLYQLSHNLNYFNFNSKSDYLHNLAGEFDDVLDSTGSSGHAEALEEIQLTYSKVNDSTYSKSKKDLDTQKLLEIESLTVQTPTNNALLIRDLSLEVCNNEHLLVRTLLTFSNQVSIVLLLTIYC